MIRFRTPKHPIEEKSWSVILNPLRSELDKRRVSEKISEFFHVSLEEARELVQNTPIVLIDQLSQSAAEQVQNFFQAVRAELTLTNDPIAKRRCFRAVWPEPPNPSPLEAAKPSESIEPSLKQAPLQKDIDERRVLEEEWQERYQGLKEEFQETKSIYEEKILEREKEFERLKNQLKERLPESDQWREKAVSLEDKYQARERELEALKGQLRELETWVKRARDLEKQNKELLNRSDHLESSKADLERSVKEHFQEVSVWREKYQIMAQKSERFESLYEGERKRREQVEESARQSMELAENWQKRFHALEENQEEINRLRDRNHELESQLEVAQRQLRDLHFHMEQQELIEKRERLMSELSLKESELRGISAEYERIQQEIRDRESQAQALAGEQASLQREILERRQAQRYLLEQDKLREKGTSKLRRPSLSPKPEKEEGSSLEL